MKVGRQVQSLLMHWCVLASTHAVKQAVKQAGKQLKPESKMPA
jgi:hypothetical protein